MNPSKAQTFAYAEACDWLDDLVDEQDPYFVQNTLEIIIDYPPGEKPDSWDCCCAMAAAEIVAAAKGKPPASLPAKATDWLALYGSVIDEEVRNLAAQAIERISVDSHLKDELVAQSALWEALISDLRLRLATS